MYITPGADLDRWSSGGGGFQALIAHCRTDLQWTLKQTIEIEQAESAKASHLVLNFIDQWGPYPVVLKNFELLEEKKTHNTF